MTALRTLAMLLTVAPPAYLIIESAGDQTP